MKSELNENISLEQAQLHKQMTQALFEKREQSGVHLALDQEYRFFNAIKDGDKNEVLKLMEPLTSEHLGKLSDNPVNNIRYHLVITIAMTTRFCIEAGLHSERAYTLSDLYIQRADKCKSTDELFKLHKEVVLEFTKAMRELKKETISSLPILKVYQYVEKHLHDKISLDTMSEEIGVSKNYLCNLFKKETGQTIGDYISTQKVNTAKDLLAYTEFSSQDISNYLGYSSMSHFIKVFKNITGMTPLAYRKEKYSKHFDS